jgi:2-polyprenyl-3-methyl-5-hydroxy-6-metoxy-1,4-benzoquinol methylase
MKREGIILQHVRGRTVLDVGCVGDDPADRARPGGVHRLIFAEAAQVVGLDIDAVGVEAMRAAGYNVIHGDAETADLGRQFQCIVAGELIEHLANPGLFLANMRRHLAPGGELVVTTPNPFYPSRMLEILLLGRVRMNPSHTCWYCPRTLERTLHLAGFADVEIHMVNYKGRLGGLGLLPTLLRRAFCTNIVAIARVERNPKGSPEAQ